jgi:hypothetical protein
MKRNTLKGLVATLVIGAAMALSSPAFAQSHHGYSGGGVSIQFGGHNGGLSFGYSSGHSNYGGYNQDHGGYNQGYGGYNQGYGGYNQGYGGYNQGYGGYNQGYGGYNGRRQEGRGYRGRRGGC